MRMDRDRDFFPIVNRLQKKQRQMVILIGTLAFILGLVLGSVWTYKSVDRVTIISTEPQLNV